MELLRESILPPGAGHQSLLELLLVLLYLIHYPYIGITIGSALCSIVLCLAGRGDPDDIYTRVGRAVGELVTFRPGALVFLGIVPLFTAALINRQLLFDSGIPVLGYQSAAGVLVAAGLFLLALYRRMLRSGTPGFPAYIGAGGLGLFLLLNGVFGFLAGSVRIIDPEKWPFIDNPVEYGLSWNAIAWFSLFLVISICVTGAAILFFFFSWERGRGKPAPADAERRFLRYLGAGLALGGALLAPVVLLLFLVTAPEVSLSAGVFYASFWIMAALMATALTAYAVMWRSTPSFAPAVLLFSLLAVLGTAVTDTIALRNALAEHLARLDGMAVELREEQEAELAKLSGAKPARSGEEVFTQECTVCHAFDVKVVGPPYMETVPPYRGDVEALKEYIRNPVKKRDDYPRMPKLGLREAEIDSVATYLIEEVEKRNTD